jgi:uncharacterized OsmC-like protein
MSIKVIISLSVLVLSLGACANMTNKSADKEANANNTFEIKKTETSASQQERVSIAFYRPFF